ARLSQKQHPDSRQRQQMNGIEKIKKIFQRKSPFPVVQVDGKEGQTGRGFPQKAQAACDCLQQRIKAEKVQYGDQKDAVIAIICFQQPGKPHACGHRTQLYVRILFITFHDHQSQKTDEESEKYVLVAKFQQLVIEGKIEGDLGEQRKDPKPGYVFSPVGGVKKSLQQQKAEDGECDAADETQNPVKQIQSVQRRTDHDGSAWQQNPFVKDSSAEVVDQHTQQRQDF